MLALDVDVAVVTNVELDHHATYGSLAELREAFRELLAGAPQAVLLGPPGDPGAARRRRRSSPSTCPTRDSPAAACASPGAGTVRLPVPGAHNALNAAAALEACALAGADRGGGRGARGLRRARPALPAARHTPRRPVVDDYAHHPTEVAATIAAAGRWPRRLVAVFQPHLYSRTAALRASSARRSRGRRRRLLDVYPARERPRTSRGHGLLDRRGDRDAPPGARCCGSRLRRRPSGPARRCCATATCASCSARGRGRSGRRLVGARFSQATAPQSLAQYPFGACSFTSRLTAGETRRA